MSISQYSRGSEWRKWDLQVHTPYSVLRNGFGDDFNAYAKRLIELACKDGIAVIGITDYFTIQGYKELRSIIENASVLVDLVGERTAEQAQNILFLPNVELRTSIVVKNSKGIDSRVNFHVLFSNEVNPEDIEEHFLHELKFSAQAFPDKSDEKWSLRPKNPAALGKRLKHEHRNFAGRSDLFIGMMNAVIDHTEVSQVLEGRSSIFAEKYLICVPCDEDLSKFSWDGQAHLMRKLMVQKAHLLFSSNKSTREFWLGRKHESLDAFRGEFNGPKPCVHGSDAHDFDTLFKPEMERYCWIKADPTFLGLRQTLNEPDERIFIGKLPPSLGRTSSHATRIATSVGIKRTASATTTEKWFDCELLLNHEMVAIIGNKGSGKSALSDIIGLLGNSPRHAFCSFLHAGKFRLPKGNKARQFKAAIQWADGKADEVPHLDVDPASDSIEKIKYIPQSYLEEICNEIGTGKGGRFYSELQQVIFSHVPEAEQLGFATLDELLAHRSEETNQAISQLVESLHETNALIIAAEERALPAHRKLLDAQLIEKRRELAAHTDARPLAIAKPDADPAMIQHSKSASAELEGLRKALQAVEVEIEALRKEEKELARKRLFAEKLLGKLKNLQRHFETFKADSHMEFAELDLSPADVVQFKLDPASVESLLHNLDLRRAVIAGRLSSDVVDSKESERLTLQKKIEAAQSRLSEPQRVYQAYLQTLKEWEMMQAQIVGSAETVGTIEYLHKQLKNLELLPADLRALRKIRDRTMLEIFREKQRLKLYYETYYGSVQDFLKRHPLATSDQFKLTFNVSMEECGFANAFLPLINRRRFGPFMSEEEGAIEMRRLLGNVAFDSPLGLLRFTKTLIRRMSERDGKALNIKDQLRQGVTMQELYDYVYSLEFLSPVYNLQWDGKRLEQLSPGERGNLLLIFYLIVDQGDIPLVIDQPEENLDNQTVFKTLVPCIKDAKKRRQIVLVTHNPNLAVVCDAEQIICAEMKKDRENAVTYVSGAIENPDINAKIVDILEGTRPAFDKRDDKYIA